MKLLKNIMIAISGLMISASCNGQKVKNDVAEATPAKNGKALIVFFSHAGENYSVGYIKVGNTKIVADYISEITGADQFEIVAEKSYDMPYSDLTKLAKEEAERNEKPAYKGDVENLSEYDTIFIGGPVWWGTYPQVMFTFFDKHAADMKGKTIIPFTTHEGSGLGSCATDVKEAFPDANVQDGFSIYGHEVRSNKAKVEKWLKGLGY